MSLSACSDNQLECLQASYFGVTASSVMLLYLVAVVVLLLNMLIASNPDLQPMQHVVKPHCIVFLWLSGMMLSLHRTKWCFGSWQ